MKCIVSDSAFVPKKAHPEDAGFDLYTPNDFILRGGQTAIIDT